MTIETYYNFIKIVECGSILSAAQELRIAQPALSTQLKKLEENLGVRLIDRGAKKITLTSAGEIFYKNAQTICSVNDSTQNEIKNALRGSMGVLRISMTPSNSQAMLHEMFDNFVQQYPSVTFQFKEALSNQVAENVKLGISEIGIIRSPIKDLDAFNVIPFQLEEICAIVAADSEYAKYDTLRLEQIKDAPIATTDVLAPLVAHAFQTIGAEPNFYLRTGIKRTALFWVSSYKNCIAMLACENDLVSEEITGCKIVRISDYDFTVKRSFLLLKDRRPSPICRNFLRSLPHPIELPE